MGNSNLNDQQKAALKKIEAQRRREVFRSWPFILYVSLSTIYFTFGIFIFPEEDLHNYLYVIIGIFIFTMIRKFAKNNDLVNLQMLELEEKNAVIQHQKELVDLDNENHQIGF